MSKRQLVGLGFIAWVGLAAAASAQQVPWRVGRWNPDSFGNQRVLLHIDAVGSPSVAHVLIPWRRRDAGPELKRLILTDAAGHRIANLLALSVSRDFGDVLFDPVNGPGDYYLYYMPYAGSVRSNYPRITYPRADSTAAASWVALARANSATAAHATVAAFEAVDSMSNRWPMEVTATTSEVAAVRNYLTPGNPFGVFVEDRTRPVKMTDQLPMLWAFRTEFSGHLGPALRDEYYAFQLGVWAQRAVDSVTAIFSNFSTADRSASIPQTAFDCINTDGVDWLGRPMHPRVDVAAGQVRALWCGVMVPVGTRPGTYQGTVTLRSVSGNPVRIDIRLAVSAQVAINHGDDEPWRLSRLRWLNSKLAAEGNPTPPYTPVRAIPGGFAILGRRIQLAETGLPRQISSAFTTSLTLGKTFHPLLRRPFLFDIEGVDEKVGSWKGSGVRTVSRNSSQVVFTSHARQGAFDLAVRGTLEFDGNLEYQVALVARRDTAVHDVRLTVPFGGRRRYVMGMNQVGGQAAQDYHWKWDVATKNQDSYWIGGMDGGMQVTLKDEHYVRPLNTNFYLQSPLKLPRSWGNDGKGTCSFYSADIEYSATCGSGPRTLVANDTLWFNFRVLITPFHAVDTKTHFSTRYMHAYKPVDSVRAVGANLVNVHHATPINPFLNYPFLRPAEMKAYADSLHAADMRLKIYYTVRELTNRAPEFWALRSLGTEVLSPGPGGGHSWLQEHVGDNYLPGWVVPELRDVTLVTSGISRWHNFYVEGMQWLTQHAGVDGIYLDDVAFDRTTMLRIRRVLAAHGAPGERIDLHSATQYNKNDGFASSANLYLEHFPFIDRLWFGEGFNYDSPPDYWLVEMSGLPFGLMGEMLEGGGNPWRGMLFGMTNRLPWTGGDPRELWKAWDDFGINDATMHGWWNFHDAPVQTGESDVLATTYQRTGRSMIAIASWAKDTVKASLRINWRALHLDSTRVRIYAPAIPAFQSARTFAVGEPIPVAPGKGWLLRIDAFDPRPRAR